MGIGGGIALLTIGAIFAFAFGAQVWWLDFVVVGWILMTAGAVTLILSLAIWNSKRAPRATIIREPMIREPLVIKEQTPPPTAPPPAPPAPNALPPAPPPAPPPQGPLQGPLVIRDQTPPQPAPPVIVAPVEIHEDIPRPE
jgi:Domain of unknown function (DUF6458)